MVEIELTEKVKERLATFKEQNGLTSDNDAIWYLLDSWYKESETQNKRY